MNTRRKPTKLRELEGNRSRRPLAKDPEVAKVEQETIPDWFPETSKAFYRTQARGIRAMSGAGQVDEPAMHTLALSFGLAMDSARRALKEGVIRKDEDGIKRKHPALQIYRDNMAIFMKMAGNFGMSPADRARLFSAEVQSDMREAEGDSPDDVLNGNWKRNEPRAQLQ